jgi:hypothetical protein
MMVMKSAINRNFPFEMGTPLRGNVFKSCIFQDIAASAWVIVAYKRVLVHRLGCSVPATLSSATDPSGSSSIWPGAVLHISHFYGCGWRFSQTQTKMVIENASLIYQRLRNLMK